MGGIVNFNVIFRCLCNSSWYRLFQDPPVKRDVGFLNKTHNYNYNFIIIIIIIVIIIDVQKASFQNTGQWWCRARDCVM